MITNKHLQQLEKKQLLLAKKVVYQKLRQDSQYIAGFDQHTCGRYTIGCLSYFEMKSQMLVECDFGSVLSTTLPPYIPGYLSLRELPVFF